MTTRAHFYGRLRDQAGATEMAIALDAPISLAEFRARLADGEGDLEAALAAPAVRVAVNDVMAPRDAEPVIRPGDQVAFMPPFSGG